jgi:hypothetical protein
MAKMVNGAMVILARLPFYLEHNEAPPEQQEIATIRGTT